MKNLIFTDSQAFKADAIQHIPAGYINANWLKMTGGLKEIRYYLKGMQFKRENNKLQIVGSNGCTLITNTEISENGPDFSVIIPAEALKILAKIKTPFTMSINSTYAKFTGEDWKIETKLIDHQYPDFSRIFKTPIYGDIHVNRKKLIQTLKDVKPFLPPQLQGVTLAVAASSLDFIHHSNTLASIPLIYSSSTKPNLGVYINYLLNALNCYKDENIMLSFRENSIQMNRDTSQTIIMMGL